ncbi:MAG: 3-deoxy-D-manno-octulosonic acid transferase [Chlamydiales bacterium]
MALFYDFLIAVLGLLALPKIAYQYVFKGRYRGYFAQRFGFSLPTLKKTNKKLIWIHAVSLGETKAMLPLAKELYESVEDCEIVISSGTETGHHEALKGAPFARQIFLPPDFSWNMRYLMKNANPELVILVETDFWYQFLRLAKLQGAKIALVNGKISMTSARRHQIFPFFMRTIFSFIDLFAVQNIDYKNRFSDLGVPLEKLNITGNLKFDAPLQLMDVNEKHSFLNRLGIPQDDPVIVAGSTHESEEDIVLEAMKSVWELHPKATLLLVPRHPERFRSVEMLLQKRNILFSRFTDSNPKPNSQVILVDAMGVLKQCYQISALSIVAGSFIPQVGGHNILEPSSYGVPVIFGPFMQAQPELLELALNHEVGVQTNEKELGKVLINLLHDSTMRKHLGDNGRALVLANQGATKKTRDLLKTLLQ